jgi:4-hydroxy-tetrahydrodipicolinate synthase
VIQTRLISAICTPLRPEESLHREGLETHLEEQWRAGIAGVLVGGTMGLMQLLSERTYRQLVDDAVRVTAGRGEVLVGVGDTSFARTRDRIRLVEEFAVDGVVVVTPFLWKYTQAELVDYYRALADLARKPVYLYDLPGLTGARLDLETVLAVASHPNVRGIKCSIPWDATRQLMDRVEGRLRVIPAQPHLIDQLVRCGVADNLDGIFALAPHWAVGVVRAAERGDWPEAARQQRRLSALLQTVAVKYPLFPACTAVLGARGIVGNVAPAPMRPLTAEQRAALLDEPVVRELLGEPR